MPDDILATVKAALAHRDSLGVKRSYAAPHKAYTEYGVRVLQFVAVPVFALNWLRALVTRCEQAEAAVEADFHQLSDVAGWHHGETQIALARATLADADLAALRQRHAEAVEKAYKDGHARGNRYIVLTDIKDGLLEVIERQGVELERKEQ
jgi:hypothetical protein